LDKDNTCYPLLQGAGCGVQGGYNIYHSTFGPLCRYTLLSDKMTSYMYHQAFGRIFEVESINNQKRKEHYEYLDNFYWFYDPELDRKYGFEIKIQEVFENTTR
jgi:hypothetical protein